MIFGNGNVPSDEGDDGAWLIVGLGNPGAEYEQTRHNLGFMVVDLLAERHGAAVKRSECRSLLGRAQLGEEATDLAKPQTYMNLSGEAVSCLLKKGERGLARTLVVVDDLALPFGSIRLRERGSSGGHNGLRSIIASLGTESFARLRIGIMPDHMVSNTRKFVLDRFSSGEKRLLSEVLERSADAVESVIADGFQFAMSRHNG